MASPLLGVKEFVIHYGGKWGRTIPGKIKTSEYKGGKQESVKYDGDEICWLDLEKDLHKPVGEGVAFQIASLIEGTLCRITEDKHLIDMWGPNGEPMIFDISDDEETAEPEARDELTENVVEEHIEPGVHLSQLDPIEPDFCTQNINDFLDELNESNNDHGDAVRVDVDEEFNHGGRYDSNSQESDYEDYCPTDSEYSDNELGNDIDAMVVNDEVKKFRRRIARYCFRHMYKNFKKVFSGELWENLAWGAAKAYKQQELTRILGVVNKTDSKALDWLDTEPRSSWARAHFDCISKCDELTNNFSESFNSWIFKIRDKPLDNIEKLVLPPENTRKVGRPKKKIIIGEDEPLKTHRKCAKCGTPGHNTLTCDTRKKGVHGKRRKPQNQGAQDHNEAAQKSSKQEAAPKQNNKDK
ncbi:hypothetical protein IFM89_035458 [Coptis chinensis]|uniref:CCHC-type domain-containing protein n=1 Tax=Coptis chinensis TaxID=261450 RepID=A0A835MBK3_9MAGN|nr:hypothetical protein IFM89_035458 [Coptis chinensis]